MIESTLGANIPTAKELREKEMERRKRAERHKQEIEQTAISSLLEFIGELLDLKQKEIFDGSVNCDLIFNGWEYSYSKEKGTITAPIYLEELRAIIDTIIGVLKEKGYKVKMKECGKKKDVIDRIRLNISTS